MGGPNYDINRVTASNGVSAQLLSSTGEGNHCLRHFRDGDPNKDPGEFMRGKRFSLDIEFKFNGEIHYLDLSELPDDLSLSDLQAIVELLTAAKKVLNEEYQL